jgi:hypothetical protein
MLDADRNMNMQVNINPAITGVTVNPQIVFLLLNQTRNKPNTKTIEA